MDGESFTTEREVTFAETDAAGFVHFTNYLKWMEEAEVAWLQSRGLALLEETADGGWRGWPVVESGCRHRVPLRFGDRVRIETEWEEVREKGLRLKFTFWRGDETVAAGFLETRRVARDPEGTLRSVKISEKEQERLRTRPL